MLLRDLKLILSNRKAIGYVSDVDVFVRLGSKLLRFCLIFAGVGQNQVREPH